MSGELRVEVNGHERTLDGPLTVGGLVDAQIGERRGVAIALDGEVVAREDWDTTDVADGARIDIVGAVQGG